MSPARPRSDHTHVLLLRGVNVGRSNRVAKESLVRWAEAAGAVDVSTRLASGNVLFRLPDGADPAAVVAGFRRAARGDAGPDLPLVLTTPGELRAALAVHDALPWAGGDPRRTQLVLLARDPGPEAAARLAALDHGVGRPAGPDRTHLQGRRLWIRCPERIADSPLTPARLDRALGVPGTARNRTTVRVLAGLPPEA